MEFLRYICLSALIASCGPPSVVNEAISIDTESDTFIVSGSNESHGGEEVLWVTNIATVQRNALIQLPSYEKKIEETREEAYISSLAERIVDAIFYDTCDRSRILSLEYLIKSELIVSLTGDAELDDPTDLYVVPIKKPWWQGATWYHAHPFTLDGIWGEEGGDVISDMNTIEGAFASNSSQVHFDITQYMAQGTRLFSWGYIPALNGIQIRGKEGVDVQFFSSQSFYKPYYRFEFEGPCFRDTYENTYVLGQ